MKVSILTWIRALNHGAILQAYSSQQVLKSLGQDVEFLDYIRNVKSEQTFKSKLSRRINQLITLDFRYSKMYKNFNKEKQVIFNESVNRLLNVGRNCDNASCDCLMVGSDMVFNLLQGYTPQVFGNRINASYYFSYAACSGGSTVDLSNKMGLTEEINKGLKKFSGLGCRDITTQKFVEDITGRKDTILNIDPVLLYGFENEQKTWDTGKWSKNQPYILIYAYHSNLNFNNEVVEIKKFANKKDYRIVSCGYYHPWCDENVNASPEEFIELVKNAQYIVTDTFHGTVFSLVCKKKFCSIIRGNGYKLKALLDESDMSDNIACSAKDIYTVLSTQNVDYEKFDKWLMNERKRCLDYLKSQLNNAVKYCHENSNK